MGCKYYKFTKDYSINNEIYFKQGDELKIGIKDGVEYVFDGCFAIFNADCEIAKFHGEIVNRLW